MATVPGSVVKGRGTPFPQGVYVGSLNKLEEAWSEDKKNLDFILTFRDNAPADENSPQIGARPLIQRVPVIRSGRSVVDLSGDDFTSEEVPFPLRLAAGQIAQLVVALGGPCSIDEDDSVSFDIEAFMEGLQAGLYNGRSVGFEVIHRKWTSKKTGRSGVAADVSRYFPVEDHGAPTAAPEDAEPAVVGEERTRA